MPLIMTGGLGYTLFLSDNYSVRIPQIISLFIYLFERDFEFSPQPS